MRRMIAAALFGAALLSAGAEDVKIATRDWVTNYVAQAMSKVNVSSSNGVNRIRSGSETRYMELIYEDATDRALVAANCTADATFAGVTNGTLFVWNGAGKYLNPAGSITATQTCLVFGGVESVHVDKYERFDGWFDVSGMLIQPSTSHAVTNGMEVVR